MLVSKLPVTVARLAKLYLEVEFSRRSSMSPDVYATWEQRGYRQVATGTWFYDRTVPMKIVVWAKPARFAYARFEDWLPLIRPLDTFSAVTNAIGG